MRGRVEAIGIATGAGEPLRAVSEIRAIANRGLEGDRYATGSGEFSDADSPGESDVTLIAAEALAALEAEHGVELSHLESRRNVLVRDIDVNELVGKRFRIGEVECIGRELAEPCTHLEGLTRPGVLRGLVHRGGLRAGITAGGSFAVGDPVAELDPPG